MQALPLLLLVVLVASWSVLKKLVMKRDALSLLIVGKSLLSSKVFFQQSIGKVKSGATSTRKVSDTRKKTGF